MKSKPERFRGVVQLGHKGCAVEVAFDPAEIWSARPKEIVYQGVKGVPVSGRLNRTPFDSWIIARWGKRFVLLSDDHLLAARVKLGDEVKIEVAPA